MSALSTVPEDSDGRPSNLHRIAGAIVAVILALTLAWFIRHALLIIYISAVFAVVLKPGIDWLHQVSILGWRPGRPVALVILIVFLCLIVGILIGTALPSIVSGVNDFLRNLQQHSGTLQRHLDTLPFLKNLNIANIQSWLSAALGRLLAKLGTVTADVLTTILLIAYFILDGSELLKSSLRVLPSGRRERLENTLYRAGKRMRQWIVGQAMLMLILGVASAVTFWFMGLPYFHLLALFAGVANIVPLLGPLATVLLASLVAVTESWWDVLGVIIFYLIYQQVENAFLTPKIMKSQVQLSSAVVIVALLVGSEFAGVAGALVAVPSAVLVAELAEEYLMYK